jgi:hypothetical protein
MAIRGREIAEAELGQYFDDFRDAIVAGTAHFWTTYEADAHRITTGCRANMLRCFIADELKQRLDGKSGIKIIEDQQTTAICFGYNWLLKVHKFDEECHAAINRTQTCLDLNDNDLYDVKLPGIPENATVVFLGYIEILGDRLHPEMRLSCPDGAKPAWAIDLNEAPELPIAEIIGGGDQQGGTKVVVKPDKGKKSSQ